jgi:GT2 family glycosyltransferase
MKSMNHSSFVISNRPHLFEPIQQSIFPEPVKYFDGSGYPSFSKLVNSCVASADTETVILMSDKVTPTDNDVNRLLELLDQGYAMAAFYRLAFFGFKKQLLRKIGMFDERFVGGGYEDDDFYIRLKEADLGVYISHEIPYVKSQSGWNYSLAQGHFVDKWGDVAQIGELKRTLEEEQYQYDLGTAVPVEFLPWDQSVILTSKVKKYTQYPIVK